MVTPRIAGGGHDGFALVAQGDARTGAGLDERRARLRLGHDTRRCDFFVAGGFPRYASGISPYSADEDRSRMLIHNSNY